MYFFIKAFASRKSKMYGTKNLIFIKVMELKYDI